MQKIIRPTERALVKDPQMRVICQNLCAQISFFLFFVTYSASKFTPPKINARFSNQIINLFFEKEKSELLIPAGWNNNQVF